MNRRNNRSRWLKGGVTALSLVATLVGWRGFAGAGSQAAAAPDGGAASAMPAPASDPAATGSVRMAIVVEPDGQTYLVQLPAAPQAAPAPMVRTQSSR